MKKVTNRIPTRNMSPFIRWFRERLAGRRVTHDHLRFEQDMSDRTQPDPCLPDGPSHQLSGNYYFMRDARCLVSQPLLIAGPDEIKKLSSGESKETRIALHSTGVTPGSVYVPPTDNTRLIRNRGVLPEAERP